MFRIAVLRMIPPMHKHAGRRKRSRIADCEHGKDNCADLGAGRIEDQRVGKVKGPSYPQ